MKNPIKIILTLTFFFASTFMMQTFADPPGPPPPGGHGSTQNELPGPAAPIDGGMGILIALGACYGSYKLYRSKKTAKEAEEVTT